MKSANQNQSINNNLNANQKGVSVMNANQKNFKVYDEINEKVELLCYFIDDQERVFSDYVWVQKAAITDNGLEESAKKDIENDVANERNCEFAKLFYIEEESETTADNTLTFFIIN